jgi:hypothetical protein
MKAERKQELVRESAARSSAGDLRAVVWSAHAVQALLSHALSRADVEQALSASVVIEDYPANHRGLPDCLVLGFLEPGAVPVHAVVAIDEVRDRILVVTTYRPDPGRWENDWKTRR